MENEFRLTQEEYDQQKAELTWLRTVERDRINADLKEAKSFGDLSENSEYDEAKSAQGKLEARIAEMEYQLAHSVIIDASAIDSSVIGVGTTVTILDVELGETMTYKIVGVPQASPDEGKISDKSPVGAALIGHKKGETVTAQTPGGAVDFEIIDVQIGK